MNEDYINVSVQHIKSTYIKIYTSKEVYIYYNIVIYIYR